MTDLAATQIETPSTVLDPNTPPQESGGGAPRTLETEAADPNAKAPSLRETVAAELKADAKPKEDAKADAETDKDGDKAAGKADAEKGSAKPEEGKATPEEKKAAERGADGKFAARQAEDGEGAREKAAPEPGQTEGQQRQNGHIEPPAKLLPDAKETWRNTPRAVQRDVANLVREHETEVTRYREAAERYEPIRQFDELVRRNGRAGIHETLAEVAALESKMAQNPIAALNDILLRAGPRKADGSPVNLYELAQHVVNSGQEGYNRMVTAQPQQQPQQQQANPEVEQLRRQLASMQEQQVAATVIDPFKRDHPRYDELRDDIAFFLQSGKISASLSPSDRLAAAYDMAVRINPASHVDNAAASQTDPEPGRRADEDFSGSKSIKSAPGAVSNDMEPERGGSTRDVLMQELRRAARK